MPIRRASLVLPCHHLEDFPTHLHGDRAAELLAAWTALWHPAILAATEAHPGWHPADAPPEPDSLDGELIVLPTIGRDRLPGDWLDRLRATHPRNPAPLEPFADRRQTIAALLAAADLDPKAVDDDSAGDFLALGYAYLQVEILTRVMRYTTVLEAARFDAAVIEAAHAALAGNHEAMRDALARAFDLISDARNHYYPVDFYLVDVTLLAPSTLGEPLRAKLASGTPTSLLAPAELIEQMAAQHPDTLAGLQRAVDAGTACVVGGRFHATMLSYLSPESMFAELEAGRRAYERHLGRGVEVFAQYESAFSTLWPELLGSLGFRAALHTAFDGGSLPQADQPKTWWGSPDGPRLEALSTLPLDASLPETWLALADRLGESIAHDHVATMLLAGWPGHECAFADDLRRVARYSAVLGKLVTLEEYFRLSREVDDWITFNPRDYPAASTAAAPLANPLSSRVDEYRRDAAKIHRQLTAGLGAVVQLSDAADEAAAATIVINSWSFPRPQFTGTDLVAGEDPSEAAAHAKPLFLPEIPACGFAALDTAAPPPPLPLAAGHTLRNERLEIVVSPTTGGIQSLRTHGDRRTRASQRLLFCDRRASSRAYRAAGDDPTPEADVPMLADRVEVTRNDDLLGEITSRGRLLDAEQKTLAHFTQTVRLPRGLAAAIVDVTLDIQRAPDGDLQHSYYASRLVWRDQALAVRRGVEWLARPTARTWIDSPEWIEITDGPGTITCFALGLPFHRTASGNRLDTLLAVAGEERRRAQFAIGLDCRYPTQTALALLTAGEPTMTKLHNAHPPPRGWFLHTSARNLLITHIEPLAPPRSGVRLRLLETEGRDASLTLAAFRPLAAAQITDFRGQPTEVISIVEGQARFNLGPHRWIQVEAEVLVDS